MEANMTEQELRLKWGSERAMYNAWGNYIASHIEQSLVDRGINASSFLKIPAKPRTKDMESLADKAFRREKNYNNPYDDIEDKVGVRFVVLLTSDIDPIDEIIRTNPEWKHETCRHYQTERDAKPMLFAYQSVHHIIRPNTELQWQNTNIDFGIPCEVQVRTLLQHAHSELTHDSIYKSRTLVKPIVHRAVAKSVALIEATDDYFIQATNDIDNGPIAQFDILNQLDALYLDLTSCQPLNHKSALILWDVFEDFVDENLIDNISEFIETKRISITTTIQKNYSTNGLYQQSIVLFLYWLASTKRHQTHARWPLSLNDFENLISDLGISSQNI